MIKVFTRSYNEEFLIPFFLRHYRFADAIHVLFTPGTDCSELLFREDPRVTLELLDCSDGVNDLVNMNANNEAISRLDTTHDWFIVADMDEFFWPFDYNSVDDGFSAARVNRFLAAVPRRDNVLVGKMFQVYRHETDSDLDPNIDPCIQRRHGNPNRETGGNEGYCKPVIFRPNLGITFSAGQHFVNSNPRVVVSKECFWGAHWVNADPCFCVTRRLRDRKDRMSRANKMCGLGAFNFNVTELEILGWLSSGLHWPKVF